MSSSYFLDENKKLPPVRLLPDKAALDRVRGPRVSIKAQPNLQENFILQARPSRPLLRGKGPNRLQKPRIALKTTFCSCVRYTEYIVSTFPTVSLKTIDVRGRVAGSRHGTTCSQSKDSTSGGEELLLLHLMTSLDDASNSDATFDERPFVA